MIIKTSELSGQAFLFAIARSHEFTVYKDANLGGRFMEGWWVSGLHSDPNRWEELAVVCTIIQKRVHSIAEKEKISVIWHDGAWRATNGTNVTEGANDFCPVYRLPSGGWVAQAGFGDQVGDTQSEAVLRCLVEMRLGQQVDVPDELSDLREEPCQERPRG